MRPTSPHGNLEGFFLARRALCCVSGGEPPRKLVLRRPAARGQHIWTQLLLFKTAVSTGAEGAAECPGSAGPGPAGDIGALPSLIVSTHFQPVPPVGHGASPGGPNGLCMRLDTSGPPHCFTTWQMRKLGLRETLQTQGHAARTQVSPAPPPPAGSKGWVTAGPGSWAETNPGESEEKKHFELGF